MGQASLAILNKVGVSVYWKDVWDSQFSYTKLFNLKRFFLKFFKFFFEDAFFFNQLFFNNHNFFLICTELDFFYTDFSQKPQKFRTTLHFFKKLFIGKIWILNKKNFFIISVYIYFPSLKITNKQEKLNKIFNNWTDLNSDFETSVYVCKQLFNKNFFINKKTLSI